MLPEKLLGEGAEQEAPEARGSAGAEDEEIRPERERGLHGFDFWQAHRRSDLDVRTESLEFFDEAFESRRDLVGVLRFDEGREGPVGDLGRRCGEEGGYVQNGDRAVPHGGQRHRMLERTVRAFGEVDGAEDPIERERGFHGHPPVSRG
jgi:hypothetical protein